MKNVSQNDKASKSAAAKQAKIDAQIAQAAAEAQAAVVTPVETVEPAPDAPAKSDAMSFAVQQLSTPVALTDAQKAEMKAELDAIKAKFGVTVAPVTKTPRAKRIEQNGIKRPLATGGICDQMWTKMDEISNAKGSPCTIGEVRAALPHFNQVNLLGEYASWRKFNGISGRLTKVAAPTVPAIVAGDEYANQFAVKQ